MGLAVFSLSELLMQSARSGAKMINQNVERTRRAAAHKLAPNEIRTSTALTDPQAKSSAALIAWLLEQYDIPAANVYGHNFTPGYNLPGGTSCPDNLFGPDHSQAAVAAWVKNNVVTS
jgi:N-acetylmuramoyl-L-alanine amidase-like protein